MGRIGKKKKRFVNPKIFPKPIPVEIPGVNAPLPVEIPVTQPDYVPAVPEPQKVGSS